jgi:hypothetical protein
MKRLRRFVALLALVPLAAFAAPPPDEFYAHAADVALLQMKAVQTELGITEAQRAKMNVFADRHRAHLEALQKEYVAAKKDPRTIQQDGRLLGYFMELKQNVIAQLSATQLKRLAEISLQHLGLASLTDDRVGAKVGLSKSQIVQMRSAYQKGGAKYAAAEKAAAQPVLDKYKSKSAKDKAASEALQKQFNADLEKAMAGSKSKLEAIKAETQKNMKAVLTAKQTSTYEALLGKPFRPK